MSLEQYALENGLKKMGARPSLVTYIKEAFKRLDFAYTLARLSNEATNAKTRLGSWWLILLPTIQAATYGLIFGLILGNHNRPDNFLPFLFTGVFLFSFVQGSFTGGAGSIINNEGLVRSISFPRVLLPFSEVLAQSLLFIPQLGVLFLIMLATGQAITIKYLLLIPLLLLMFLFNFGLATTMARITVHITDLNKLIPFMIRILFYLSGVFFSVDRIFTHTSFWGNLLKLNPIMDFLNLARGCLLNGYEMRQELWITVSVWSVGLALLGLIFFWSAEERYGRED